MLAHFHSPLCNIELASGTNNTEDNSNSKDSIDDFQIISTDVSLIFIGIKYQIPPNKIQIHNYAISIWQPPKIS
jgi:phosphatidylethanolamine-binding protein (PEBP) family uncharacterized protein